MRENETVISNRSECKVLILSLTHTHTHTRQRGIFAKAACVMSFSALPSTFATNVADLCQTAILWAKVLMRCI